jgi:hypothetical protein
MRLTRLFAVIVLAATLASAPPASAGWVNELGRNLGLGWSDGYHAYEGCPDSRLRSQPWQRRANRGGAHDEPLVHYLEPIPAPASLPAPAPLPQPKMSRTGKPGSTQASTSSSPPARASQLHISRPNY